MFKKILKRNNHEREKNKTLFRSLLRTFLEQNYEIERELCYQFSLCLSLFILHNNLKNRTK